MKAYLDILREVYTEGTMKSSRPGIMCKSVTAVLFKHDMSTGFPLLTTKKMGLKNICTELEFFIKGLSSKAWLQERKCHIWDEWCNPQKVPYSTDKEQQERMKAEDDLGRIYGVQWRDWRGLGSDQKMVVIDQFQNAIEALKKDPCNRRMLISAWNPAEIDQMALPPCHDSFQLLSDGEHVDLVWRQRSVDVPLGLPYNIASYAMLLLLIARTVGLKPRWLAGQLSDVHIYQNQLEIVPKQLLLRKPSTLPQVTLPPEVTDVYSWQAHQFELTGYTPEPILKYPISV